MMFVNSSEPKNRRFTLHEKLKGNYKEFKSVLLLLVLIK